METASAHSDASTTCTFCGLLCDDLALSWRDGALASAERACAKARRGFEAVLKPAQTSIDGVPSSLEAALDAAAAILAKSKRPLIAGLGTDVAGMRAALALGERCGAVLDHLHGEAMARQLRVLQSRGLTLTTLGEVRNRADLVVLLGVDLNQDFPRFAERCIAPVDTLAPSRTDQRRVFHVGPANTRPRLETPAISQIPCPQEQLADMLQVLRALHRGRTTQAPARTRKLLQPLVEAIKEAEYTVFVWAPGQLDPGSADLTIAGACELISDLNQKSRAAGLSLGGNDGGQSALAASAWITGYPLPVSFTGPQLAHDPITLRSSALLASNDVDALVWVSTFSDRLPPDTTLPRIVIGNAGSLQPGPGTLCLAAGTPGVDHAGQLIRTDGVVALPVQRLLERGLPSAAAILNALLARLG